MTDAHGSLSEVVAETAAGIGVAAREVEGGRDYLVGETIVVEVRGEVVSFRLRPDIAVAAARTPDAGPSPRGPEWVAFTPRSLDRFARDRIEAWFEFAVRQGRAD